MPVLAKGLGHLVATTRPLYLITTRHVPPTYFGAVPPRHLSEADTADQAAVSTVFAFRDRGLATDIALGLEHHRATRGAYPPLDTEELDLVAPGDGGALRELEVREASVPEVLRMVSGSGLALSIMYRDSRENSFNETDSGADNGNCTCRSVDVRPTRGVDRSWLETVFGMCALLPKPLLPKPERRRRRDSVTDPAKGRAYDFFARMLLAIWMMVVGLVI
jgi:hypothetical protein